MYLRVIIFPIVIHLRRDLYDISYWRTNSKCVCSANKL